jgi:hypothetical protein
MEVKQAKAEVKPETSKEKQGVQNPQNPPKKSK